MRARMALAAFLSAALALVPPAEAASVGLSARAGPAVPAAVGLPSAPSLALPSLGLPLSPMALPRAAGALTGVELPSADAPPPSVAAPAARAAVPGSLPNALEAPSAPVSSPAAAAPGPAAPAAPGPTAPAAAGPTAPAGRWAGAAPAQARAFTARFAELKAAFLLRGPVGLPSGSADAPQARPSAPQPLAPAASEARPASAAQPPGAPPAPPSEPALPPSRPGGPASRSLRFFLLALVVDQLGLEMQSAGMPPFIAKVYGSVSLAADVGIASSLAEIAGNLLAPAVYKRLGTKRAYLWGMSARVVLGALLAGLLAAHALPIGGLAAFYAGDSVLSGVTWTAEKAIPAQLVHQDQARLERFKAARQIGVQTAATFVPIAAGAIIASLGFLPALVAFPLAAAATTLIVAATLKLPAVQPAPLQPQTEPGGQAAAAPASSWRAALVVAKSPKLLLTLSAYCLVYVPVMVIYWILAPAFGLLQAGAAGAQAAAGFSGMTVGLYSLGGLLAGALMMREQRRLEREQRSGALDLAGRNERLRRSMLRWTTIAALSMAAFGTLALGLPSLGALAALPAGLSWLGRVTLPAVALLGFGAAQIVSKLKLESFYQANVPKSALGAATAVMEASSSLTIAAGLWLFKVLLLHGGITGWAWLAGGVLPLSLVVLALRAALARVSRPRAGSGPAR